MRQDEARGFHHQLGALLAALREERGLSQEALAVRLRRDQSYISRIEAGERHASVTFLLEWSDALEVPFEALAARVAEVWKSLAP